MIPPSEHSKSDLAAWLDYIGQVHPREIELGLTRSATVAQRLGLDKAPLVITIAGTNGKGSVVTVLEQILCQSDIVVGCYTSPHIDRFNERIRVRGVEVEDGLICEAFAAIEQAREDIPLSYFGGQFTANTMACVSEAIGQRGFARSRTRRAPGCS